MKKPYKVCPFCHGELVSTKHINTQLYVLNMRISFISDVCNCYNDFIVKRDHNFYQVQSLYGDLYFERFTDRTKSIGVMVDHIHNKTKFFTKLHGKSDKIIVEYDKVFDMDYPDLVKIKNKMKTLVLFS